ncbi:MAG: hypothetical protein AB7T06_31300 [Kofleriaceae bacterium]
MTWAKRNPDRFNASWRKWYRANAKRKIAWQARRRAELRQWLDELRAKHSCDACGETTVECLQFHHLDPTQKDLAISQVITNGWSKERILREIAKCRVLCANCHLKLHWEQRVRQ